MKLCRGKKTVLVCEKREREEDEKGERRNKRGVSPNTMQPCENNFACKSGCFAIKRGLPELNQYFHRLTSVNFLGMDDFSNSFFCDMSPWVVLVGLGWSEDISSTDNPLSSCKLYTVQRRQFNFASNPKMGAIWLFFAYSQNLTNI